MAVLCSRQVVVDDVQKQVEAYEEVVACCIQRVTDLKRERQGISLLHVIATIGFMFGLTGTALGALAVLSMPGGVDLSAVRLKLLGDASLRQMSPNFYSAHTSGAGVHLGGDYTYNGLGNGARGQQFSQDNMYR